MTNGRRTLLIASVGVLGLVLEVAGLGTPLAAVGLLLVLSFLGLSSWAIWKGGRSAALWLTLPGLPIVATNGFFVAFALSGANACHHGHCL